MLRSEFFGVVFEHIWIKHAFIFVIMHDHWFDSRIEDIDRCFTVLHSFLDGEACHSFQKPGKGLLSGNEVSKGVEDQHIVSLIVRHPSIRLQDMWMTADYDINTLLHQEGGPFFLIFRRHRFFFLAPVSDKDQHVAGGFGFLDHGGDFILVEEINHVFISFADPAVVGSVCIIQKRNRNPVYFQCLDCISIFLCRVDSKDRNIRIFAAPEIKGFLKKINSIIIDMVCCGFYDIESCIHQCITDFRRSCKRRVRADSIMFCSKNSLLVDHCHISSLDLITYFVINLIIIPGSGIIFAGFDQTSVIKIVADSNHTCCGNFRFFSSFLCRFCFLLGDFGSFFFGFLDKVVVKLT